MNIRQRISLISFLILSGMAAVLVLAFVLFNGQMNQRLEETALLGNRLIWDQLVHDHLRQLELLREEIENEFDLRSALKQGDATKVREYAQRYVQLTGGGNGYDDLLIFDRGGEQVYRSVTGGKIEGLGRYLERATAESQVMSNLFAVRDNGIVAAAVIPLKSRSGLIGSAVYVRGLQRVVEQLAQRASSAAGLLDASGALFIDKGLGDQPTALPGTEPGKPELSIKVDGGRHYQVSRQPVLDAEGEWIADLVVSQDATTQLLRIQDIKVYSLLVLIIGIGVALLLYYYLVKHFIATPAIRIRDHLQLLADGDLSRRLDIASADEFGDISNSVNQVSERLGGVISELTSVARGVVDASENLKQASETNLGMLQKQQGETNQAATAMTEMSATVGDIASNASQTASMASQADNLAVDGHQVVNDVVAAMRKLQSEVQRTNDMVAAVESDSNEISTILDVIRGIAEQTNLLALNAAIEAARAGEQGRGFAVVADEVRTLASRTQQSTAEIQEMIERLQQGSKSAVTAMQAGRDQAEGTASLAESAGEALVRITRSVATINDASTQIASAAEQQSVVSNEVTRNVQVISDLSQSILNQGESVQATSQQLHRFAERLDVLAEHFKT